MSENKLIRLFLKELNPPVNINGLHIVPHIGNDKITWEIKNPNNLSYSSEVIEGHIQELLYEFQEITGTRELPIWKNCWSKYCRISKPKVYINKELNNRISQKCDRLNSITLEDEGKSLTSDCYVLSWSIESRNGVSIFLHVSLELSNPKIEEIGDIDDDTLAEFIEEFSYNETAQEQETDILWDIITEILEDSNMYDNDYMTATGLIKYFNRSGKELR